MVDTKKPTMASLSEIKKLEEEISQQSIAGEIEETKNAYDTMVEELRGLASRISEQGKAVVALAQILSSKSSTISRLIGGTLSFVDAGTFPKEADYLTDEAKFLIFCEKAASHVNKIKSLNTIRQAIDEMNELITDQRQKLAKMQNLDGRTEAEIAVFKRKAYQGEKTIGFLLKRGETLTNLFYAIKRKIEQSVNAAARDIHPIFCKK